MAAATVSGPEPARRGLLRCGAAAGPLFVSVFLIEGARRPGYRPLRHPVSSLSLGPRGWVQVANFATTGMLYLAGATGLARSPGQAVCSRIAVAALGSAGLGLLGSAMFRTDPVSGYPPGTPDAPAKITATGTMHNFAAVPIFDDGDPGARRAVEDAATHVGLAIAAAVNLLNPQLVVIGGDLAQAGELLLQPVRTAIRRAVLPATAAQVTVVCGQLGEHAEVLGAASLALADMPRRLNSRARTGGLAGRSV